MDDYLDIYELGEKLNFSVSWLYALVSKKKIPHLKVGRVIRFDPAEVDKWLKEKKVKPRDD